MNLLYLGVVSQDKIVTQVFLQFLDDREKTTDFYVFERSELISNIKCSAQSLMIELVI